MSDLGQLTSEQMLMLQQMGLLMPSVSFSQSGGGSENARTNVQTASSDGASFSMGSIGGSVPHEYGSFRGGLSVNQFSTPQQSRSEVAPTASVQMGPLSLTAGRQFSDNPASLYGGSLNIGPVELGYQRQATDKGNGSDTYTVNVPLDVLKSGAALNASMTRGERMPTQYQAGLSVPGLLGGVGDIAVRRTPDTRETALYARYRRQF